MREKQCVIIADDLTGANDTAIQFVKQGFSALVLAKTLSPGGSLSRQELLARYDVLSLNSDSRSLPPADAREAVRGIVRALKESGGKRGEKNFYKKMDSVLRGNPAQELEALMDELDVPLALVAPSFPANRSTVKNGILNSGAGTIDALQLFAQNMKRPVENIPLEVLRQGGKAAAAYVAEKASRGASVFLADAESDGDLQIVGQIPALLDDAMILAGAAGFARQIAGALAADKQTADKQIAGDLAIDKQMEKGEKPVLVIAGTRQGETAQQITTLAAAEDTPIVRFDTGAVGQGRAGQAVEKAYGEAAALLGKNSRVCIVAVDSMFRAQRAASGEDFSPGREALDGQAIAAALGTLAKKLLSHFSFSSVIATGGDIALGVCMSLEALGIEPREEVCPGIPIGRLVGGPWDGLWVVTKSGRFGNPGALADIVTYIKGKRI